ncbi:hypothetical protein TrRE_jg3288 [Triparma retinervis]|uniref:Uncharacterized protein n=1 Tax=Triparma retinervis TaxID=2557542 RepID=A0A9W6ZKB2_9STRA|nr:hypothetical protein TrRE_jg3288 [Triparma retinervis]
MVQVQLNHPKIPKIASIIDVPLGSQEIPVPFLALPTTALGLFGFIMTVNVQLLYEGDEELANEGQTASEAKAAAKEGAGKVMSSFKSFNPFAKTKKVNVKTETAASTPTPPAEGEKAKSNSISLSTERNITEFKKIKIALGFNFRIEDITGIISISIPELPIWVMDAAVDAEELKKAKVKAQQKAKGIGKKIGK